MLKWLKEEVINQLLTDVRRNAKRYDLIVELLRSQSRSIAEFQREVETQMSELSDQVQAIKDDVVRIGDGVKKVLEKLTQPNPDVDAAVAVLKEADAGLDAAADAMDAALGGGA